MRPVLLFVCTFVLPVMPAVFAQKEPAEAVSKAVPLESAELLKIPEGLDTKAFVMAKTAPHVEIVEFANLENHGKGTLWSSWGDGCVASNGKYYTSVGDHLGKDANAYIYEYDPMTKVLRRVVDVLAAIAHKLGFYGHGKVHSGIHEGADGKLYFTTYWGKQGEVKAAYEKGFEGSLLLRYDPKTGKTENLGAIVPKQGLPASLFDPSRQLLYFHAVYDGDIAVYDLKAGKVKFQGGKEKTHGNRTFMVDATGKVYFSGKDNHLHYYDPDANELKDSKVELPLSKRVAARAKAAVKKKGKKEVEKKAENAEDTASEGRSVLRAFVNRPAKDGTLYGMTAAGDVFAFQPKTQSMKNLGPNFLEGDYTAVMVLSPDEKYLYYAPGAHGSGARTGVPVVQFDLATGTRKVLAFLQAPLKSQRKYNMGGTYNVQIDPAGERLYMTFNGAEPGMRGVFGKPIVVVLDIPKSER